MSAEVITMRLRRVNSVNEMTFRPETTTVAKRTDVGHNRCQQRPRNPKMMSTNKK